MRAARAVIEFPSPVAERPEPQSVTHRTPLSIMASLRIESARTHLAAAQDEALAALTPAELVLLVEHLRSSLSDMFSLAGIPSWQQFELQGAEEANLAVMDRRELQVLAGRLRRSLTKAIA